MKYALIFVFLFSVQSIAQQALVRLEPIPEKSSNVFSGDFGVHSLTQLDDNNNSGLQFTPKLNAELGGNHAIGAEINYFHWFTPSPAEGWSDLVLDYVNAYIFTIAGFKTSYQVNAYFPTSQNSQKDGMNFGSDLDLQMSQKFGKYFSLTLNNSVGGYSFQYDTAANGIDYNSPFEITDRATITFYLTKSLKWNTGMGYTTFEQFDGGYNNMFRGSTGLTLNISKSLSAEWYFKYKSKELNDLTLIDGSSYTMSVGVTGHF